MDAVPSINAPSQPTPAATLRPDQSRVVETGGVIATRADTPTATPSSLGQVGAVTKSQLADGETRNSVATTSAPERVLKPYGVAMLPEGPTDLDQSASKDVATSEVETQEEA